MNRPLLVFAFFAAATAALAAQEGSQSSPYSGVSNPPPDDTIQTDTQEQAPAPKPPASHVMPVQQAAPTQSYAAPAQPAMSAAPIQNSTVTGTDDGIVQAAPPQTMQSGTPTLANRAPAYDPDGDIVHPQPMGQGDLAEGTMIRVRLLGGLSSGYSQPNERFRARVASDVLQGGQVVIPVDSVIEGRVASVSTGAIGNPASLLLKPEVVTLPNGETVALHAMVSSVPATHTKVNSEGEISPDARVKRGAIEYTGAVGTGVVAGAYLGGPVGALAGGLVGAGLVTVHLLVSHPQTHLEEGDVLMLTLTERMHLQPAPMQGQ
jgi:hypothetical protein